MGLASEDEVFSLFDDCDIGAIPPIGAAYDVPVIVDDSLGDAADIYFEGGDHRTLVHVSGKDFRDLTMDARHARFSHRGLLRLRYCQYRHSRRYWPRRVSVHRSAGRSADSTTLR